jgi:phosphotransferase system  glucose/maltose/N-acetylglucosamine-specific IIC component
MTKVIPLWASKPFTMKRTIALITWWLMCLILPPVSVVIGGIVGAVVGAADGMVKAVVSSYNDLKQWWEMFEAL